MSDEGSVTQYFMMPLKEGVAPNPLSMLAALESDAAQAATESGPTAAPARSEASGHVSRRQERRQERDVGAKASLAVALARLASAPDTTGSHSAARSSSSVRSSSLQQTSGCFQRRLSELLSWRV